MMIRKLIIAGLVLAMILVTLLFTQSTLRDWAIERRLRDPSWRFQTGLLTDGHLHVVTVGTGSPALDADRVQSCLAVLADGAFILFDAGAASAWRAEQLRLPLADLNAVFLSHLHSDHIADLPLMANISWRYGRKHPLIVFGPEGSVKMMAGFNQAYQTDAEFRHADMKEYYEKYFIGPKSA